MRGPPIRVLMAAVWLVCPPAAPLSAAPLSKPRMAPVAQGTLLLAADDDRDIVRLLPPGVGRRASDSPALPELPFPGGPVPGQGLKLTGHTITVPITFQPWPGNENQAYVGIRLDGVTDPALAAALGLDQGKGVFVVDTTPGAPGAQAGLRFGDFITALDGTPVTDTNTLVAALKSRTPGTEGTLTVWRVGDDAAAYLTALQGLAERGSTPAMMFLARLYTNGTGVTQSPTAAVGWYKKAALAGSTNGMLLYGDALASGTGSAKDLAEGQKWIAKSAEAGNAAGIFRLGRMYRDGEGVTRDPLEALGLFKKAAGQNYTPAMVAAGIMFEGGNGLEADPLQAVQWYKKAADAGDAEGMAALGVMYATGRGVERNYQTSAAWYGEGVKRGQPMAIHNLAVLYDKGLGVGRDPDMASGLVYRALEMHYAFTYQQMTENSRNWTREFRKSLQQRLQQGGFYSGPLDGSFGRSTFDAINAMMKAP